MNKSEITKNYNIDKIVTAKELASLSKTYQDNLDTIIVMMKRKESQPKVPKYFTEFVEQNNKILQQILDRLTKIEERLGKHESLFKTHGWIL